MGVSCPVHSRCSITGSHPEVSEAHGTTVSQKPVPPASVDSGQPAAKATRLTTSQKRLRQTALSSPSVPVTPFRRAQTKEDRTSVHFCSEPGCDLMYECGNDPVLHACRHVRCGNAVGGRRGGCLRIFDEALCAMSQQHRGLGRSEPRQSTASGSPVL